MFTGIVEEKGKLIDIKMLVDDGIIEYTFQANKVLEDIKIGESIATNGACLTVVEIGNTFFKANLLQETLNITNFKYLEVGKEVNLERAMKLSDRLNGHLVSGHVEKVYKVSKIEKEHGDLIIDFKYDDEDQKYLTLKGSVTINGVSLTIAKLNEHFFTVCLIPITQAETNLKDLKIGDFVNVEFDLLAKYVERLLKYE